MFARSAIRFCRRAIVEVKLPSSADEVKRKYAKQFPREWAVFSAVDTSCTGWISRAELFAMCEKFGIASKSGLVARTLDKNGDGVVSFEAFVEGYEDLQKLRIESRMKGWKGCIGLGIAGNAVGHMQQAGEATAPSVPFTKPVALFPFYVPYRETSDYYDGGVWTGVHKVTDRLCADLGRLGRFPVTNAVLNFPRIEGSGRVQLEPEFALKLHIVYDPFQREAGKAVVQHLVPVKLAAFNDCSIRYLPTSEKLSEKKNWGYGSKGVSLESFDLGPGDFSPDGLASEFVLASYVKRDGVVHKYTKEALGQDYLLFYDPLLEWIKDQMNDQQDTDKWEDINRLLLVAEFPQTTYVCLGGGDYTDWGRSNFMQPGDEAAVIVYNKGAFPQGLSEHDVTFIFADRYAGDKRQGIIALHQTFI